MIVKHLYQRTVKRNNRNCKVWYFWFEHDGKQVRKSCGTSIKRDAMAYVASLKDEDLIPETPKEIVTFNDFCTGMFDKDSEYLLKLKNRGTVYMEKTREQKANYLKQFLERFGDVNVQDITFGIIDDWLLRQKRSNSWRNNVLSVIRMIFDELYVYNLIKFIPTLKYYKRIDQEEKGILYPEEIKSLFPEDTNELLEKWKLWAESNTQDFIFATMIYTILTTGMRSGEVRALKYSQFIREDAIFLDAMFNSDSERVQHLKSANDTNKKWRIAILPQRTIKMIEQMKLMEGPKDSDYVFEYHGEPYSGEYLNRHFQDILMKNGIDHNKRNITLHSLRYTYDTMMNREIEHKDLRLMMGHSSIKMTEYYNKLRVLDHLPELLENKGVIDSVFN